MLIKMYELDQILYERVSKIIFNYFTGGISLPFPEPIKPNKKVEAIKPITFFHSRNWWREECIASWTLVVKTK